MRREKERKSGQTAIEYLLLIGAAVIFVAIVALATRNIILPGGQVIEIRGGSVATAKASFAATPSPIITPSSAPSLQISDVRLEALGLTRMRISWKTNLPADGRIEYVKIEAPAWGNAVSHADLRVAHSLELPAFTEKLHSFTIISAAGPLIGIYSDSFTMPALEFYFQSISGITESAATVHWRTNYLTDADKYMLGTTNPPALGVTTLSSTLDHVYAFGGLPADTKFYTRLKSAVQQPDGSYYVKDSEVRDFRTLGGAAAVPTCVLTASPDRQAGPFNSLVVATFENLEAGMSTALIKCDAADAGETVGINLATKTASRTCVYPQVSLPKTYTASASASGSVVVNCQKEIIDEASETPACIVSNCQLTEAAKPFYNLIVRPLHERSPDEITIFKTSDICNTVGGACETDPCRVRGSQVGENVCALIEDWVDFDWNDFIFSTFVSTFNPEERMLEVTMEACDTSAKNELTVEFEFGSLEYIRDLETGETKSGTSMEFLVWPQCQGHMGETRRFFISDNPPGNWPPVWANIPAIGPVKVGSNAPSLDLWNYVSDETPDIGLQYQIILQSDPSVISCTLDSNRYVNCGPALNKGYSDITVIAMDPDSLYSQEEFRVLAGLQFDLPEEGTLNSDPWLMLLWPLTADPAYPDSSISYTLVSQSDTSVADCKIEFSNRVTCRVFSSGRTDVTVRATNPAGDFVEDTVRLIKE